LTLKTNIYKYMKNYTKSKFKSMQIKLKQNNQKKWCASKGWVSVVVGGREPLALQSPQIASL